MNGLMDGDIGDDVWEFDGKQYDAEESYDAAFRVFNIYNTVMTMLHDRGFKVDTEKLEIGCSDRDIAFQRFWECNRGGKMDDLLWGGYPAEQGSNFAYVFYIESNTASGKIPNAQFKTVLEDTSTDVLPLPSLERMNEFRSTMTIIFITKQGLTAMNHDLLQTWTAKANAKNPDSWKVKYESWVEEELVLNVKNHVLVPRHQLLSEEEKATLLQKYKLNLAQLPRIQKSDPIARYYGLQTGEVVRILRASPTAGRYVSYRVVTG